MTSEPVAFFNLTEDQLSDANIDATAEAIYEQRAQAPHRSVTYGEASIRDRPIGGVAPTPADPLR